MATSIKALAARSTSLVAVCRKCGKKLGGGFGPKGKASLAKALQRELVLGKGKRARVRVVETGCLKYCPKGAVVVLRGGVPGEVLIVPRETPVLEVAARLGLLEVAAPLHDGTTAMP